MISLAVAAATLAASSGPAVLAPQMPIGTMSIPRIHLVTPVDEGSAQMYQAGVNWPPELNRGPAHYPGTAYPWQLGTVAFAGHRVTHTHPFLRLNELRRGDRITIRTKWGMFHYRVRVVKVVSNSAARWVLKWGGHRGHRLVLTACNPPHYAINRIVVFAQRS